MVPLCDPAGPGCDTGSTYFRLGSYSICAIIAVIHMKGPTQRQVEWTGSQVCAQQFKRCIEEMEHPLALAGRHRCSIPHVLRTVALEADSISP